VGSKIIGTSKKSSERNARICPRFSGNDVHLRVPQEHGIVPNRAVVKHFATDTIAIKQQMTFKQISDLLDVPVAQLQVLNPSYKLNVIPFYQNENHYLRLPQEKNCCFVSNEAQIYAYVQHEWINARPFEMQKHW
jgi:membrane-bound lytic murein transglycosylase D